MTQRNRHDVVASKEEVPLTVQLWLPLSKIAARAEVTTTFPVIVDAPRFTGPVADNETLLPVSETSPEKTFVAAVKLMPLVPALIVVVPAT